jgi:hypothetical protein
MYCSDRCKLPEHARLMREARLSRPKDDRARFFRKVDYQGSVPGPCPSLGPCWIWTGSRNGGGYGSIKVGGRTLLAHRFAWVLHHGQLTADQQVLHRCDNPPCVNPRHLFLGNPAMNCDDKHSKGRQGPRTGNPRLTPEDVVAIRVAHAGGTKQTTLAKRFGVTQVNISRIILRKTWAELA